VEVVTRQLGMEWWRLVRVGVGVWRRSRVRAFMLGQRRAWDWKEIMLWVEIMTEAMRVTQRLWLRRLEVELALCKIKAFMADRPGAWDQKAVGLWEEMMLEKQPLGVEVVRLKIRASTADLRRAPPTATMLQKHPARQSL
jgi:hypothetical protein